MRGISTAKTIQGIKRLPQRKFLAYDFRHEYCNVDVIKEIQIDMLNFESFGEDVRGA